jgi:hypothetical protein
MKTFRLLVLLLIVAVCGAGARAADGLLTAEQRLERLEKAAFETKAWAGASFMAGVMCALWAQNSGRNAWLWFFLGFILSFFALLALLHYNAQDLAGRRRTAPE